VAAIATLAPDAHPCLRLRAALADILAIVEPTVGDPMAPDDERDRYTLTMCCKDTVPRYGPPLATGGHYKRDEYFRQVLLTKRTSRLTITTRGHGAFG